MLLAARNRLLPGLCLASCLILVAGCQQATETVAQKALENALGVEVKQDGDQVVFKGDAGGLSVTSGASAALPDGFPKDVPLPEDATIESVMEYGDTQIVTLAVPGALESVIDRSAERMAEQGWEQAMRAITAGEGGMLAYSKKGGGQDRSASLMFSTDEGKVQLVASVKTAAARN